MEMGLNCGTGFSGFKSIAIKLESGSRFLRTRTGTGVFEKKEIWLAQNIRSGDVFTFHAYDQLNLCGQFHPFGITSMLTLCFVSSKFSNVVHLTNFFTFCSFSSSSVPFFSLPLIFPSLHPPLGIRNEKTNKRIGS